MHATDVHMAFEKVHQLQDWIRKRGERYACSKQVCSIALESSKVEYAYTLAKNCQGGNARAVSGNTLHHVILFLMNDLQFQLMKVFLFLSSE